MMTAQKAGPEADCMYWLRHDEAALLILLAHFYDGTNRASSTTIARKLAKQWIGYENNEGKKSKTPPEAHDAIRRIAKGERVFGVFRGGATGVPSVSLTEV